MSLSAVDIRRLFYLLLLCTSYPQFLRYLSRDLNLLSPFGPLQFLPTGWITSESLTLMLGLYLATTVAVIQRPSRVRMIAASSAYLFFHALMCSLGKPYHTHHCLAFAALAFLLFSGPPDRDVPRAVAACQVMLIAAYFSAGLWKLRTILHSPTEFDPTIAFQGFIAYAVAEMWGPVRWVRELGLEKNPYMGYSLYGVILFQLSAAVVLVRPYLWRIWTPCAVVFHFSTGMFAGIWFPEQVVTLLFFGYLLVDGSSSNLGA